MARRLSAYDQYQQPAIPPGTLSRLIEQWQADDRHAGMIGRRLNAQECADYCRQTIATYPAAAAVPVSRALAVFCWQQGIEPPDSDYGWLPKQLRLESPEWWAAQLSRTAERRRELAEIAAGRVRLYCSEQALQAARERRQRLADWMSRAELHDRESGEVLPLAVVAAGSISNPEIARTELMVRIRGLEEFALSEGHAGRFLTLTAPAAFHRNAGPRWAGVNPRQVQQYFCLCWERARAALHRAGIELYGVRIVEPHTDGCPHWHLLFWAYSNRQARQAVTIIRAEFLRVAGNEPGAQRNRCKTVAIDPYKGGAAAYVAKYISKNIDGAEVGQLTDRDGAPVAEGATGAERVKAWASCWRIRQFQFFGADMPPAGLWREFRRVRDPALLPQSIRPLWCFADGGEWAGFVREWRAMEIRPAIWRWSFADELAELAAIRGGIDAVTDDDMQDMRCMSRYQEPREMVRGIVWGDQHISTRQAAVWEVRVQPREPEPLQPADLLHKRILSRYGMGDDLRVAEIDWSDAIEYGAAVGLWSGGPEGPPPLDLWQ